MSRPNGQFLPYSIVTFDVWFWVLVMVIAAISWQFPMFLLLLLLLAWRAGELWILWRMLPHLARNPL